MALKAGSRDMLNLAWFAFVVAPSAWFGDATLFKALFNGQLLTGLLHSLDTSPAEDFDLIDKDKMPECELYSMGLYGTDSEVVLQHM